jgi:cell division protein ZapA
METPGKVTVKIYGQEYTIAGGQPRDYIIRVADHVDETMSRIAEAVGGGSVASLAVLTAINITDELYDERANHKEADSEKEQMQKDIEHYAQLWEEAKKNFLQYKEDAQQQSEAKDKLQERVSELSIDNDSLLKLSAEKDNKIAANEERIKKLEDTLRSREEGSAVTSEQIKELEDRYKEIEGNYFELQMENIRLKGELERYRKTAELEEQ